ncbi:hypothetical protein [Longitalea luteola]|uniref:hypothetical protein n=1 Tax=Longitalea luteola TaxID=2812563 RepID=UPI001A97AF51|nr:hypothetical protein [Longitalea luteola]
MIRTILFAAMLVSAVTVKAQMPLSFGAMNGGPAFRHFHQLGDTNHIQKKWFFTKYAGISTGLVVFNGGSASFLSAPAGLQINRQLNNNVYAFAGVSATPSFINFNGAFYQPVVNKQPGFMNGNNFSVNPAAYLGLMYINDDKTFSISGSIGVSRSNYYNYSPFYAPAYTPGFGNNKRFY